MNREGEGLYDKINGLGAHEVVIETPKHDETLSTFFNDKVMKVLTIYRERIVDLAQDRRAKYVLIFKNHGAPATGSLEHSHSQITTLPLVPKWGNEENNGAIALTPFASRFPFETWVLPKDHRAYFHCTRSAQFEDLASLLSDVLRKIEGALPGSPDNFMLHTNPSDERDEPFYHWHIEIIPKLKKVAGFEWGTGFCINPTPPEEAAKYLREARPQEDRG